MAELVTPEAPILPLPRILRQTWLNLSFLHWAVAPGSIAHLYPPDTEPDTFEGSSFVGVVPFRMAGVRMRGTPAIPGLSRFPELNVRTYVVRDGKPGVWFFSLDAASAVAVWGARTLFHLPYFLAAMSCAADAGWILYESHRKRRRRSRAVLRARYRAIGDVFHAQPASLEHFLAERYCLYTADEKGRIIRCEIHHPPWPLQLAEAEMEENTMAAAAGIAIAEQKPELLHFSRRQEVVVWAPQVLK